MAVNNHFDMAALLHVKSLSGIDILDNVRFL